MNVRTIIVVSGRFVNSIEDVIPLPLPIPVALTPLLARFCSVTTQRQISVSPSQRKSICLLDYTCWWKKGGRERREGGREEGGRGPTNQTEPGDELLLDWIKKRKKVGRGTHEWRYQSELGFSLLLTFPNSHNFGPSPTLSALPRCFSCDPLIRPTLSLSLSLSPEREDENVR